MKTYAFLLIMAAALLGNHSHAQTSANPTFPGYVSGELLPNITPSAHASTILEVKDGLLCAFFAGTDEGNLDVGIWLTRHNGSAWSVPVEVADGAHDDVRVRYPLWNPVLFQPQGGPIYLFYKEGPTPASWWGMFKTSTDEGKTWSVARKLPLGHIGPVRSKPVQLKDGRILAGSSTEDAGWRVHMEWTENISRSSFWTKGKALNSPLDYGAIQPTIIDWGNGEIQILCRTKQRQIVEAWSNNRGETFSRMKPTSLPNPDAGIEALKLSGGGALLVYNHTERGRGVLNVAMTEDGRKWLAAGILENTLGSEFSYPAAIQSSDGKVHVTYTWNRQKIKHAVIDPTQLQGREMTQGHWPK